MTRTLLEWARVLEPGRGLLRLAVPDVQALARILAPGDAGLERKMDALRVLFGGHVDDLDVHHSGFDRQLLLEVRVSPCCPHRSHAVPATHAAANGRR